MGYSMHKKMLLIFILTVFVSFFSFGKYEVSAFSLNDLKKTTIEPAEKKPSEPEKKKGQTASEEIKKEESAVNQEPPEQPLISSEPPAPLPVEETSQGETKEKPGKRERRKSRRTSSEAVISKGEVSFNFDDADVFSVVQTILGDVLSVDYIIDPRVRGRVNFRSVKPVARQDILPLMEVILRLNGVGIVEEGGLYRIVPIGDLTREPTPVSIGRESGNVRIEGKALLQVIPVHYVPSTELAAILTPFMSASATIIDIPKSNHIVVVDTDTNVKRLLQLIEIFDSDTLKKSRPQVFVYPVQNSKAKDVANMLQQIFLGSKPAVSPKAVTPVRSPSTTQRPDESAAAIQQQITTTQTGGGGIVSDLTRIIPDEIQNTITILATPDDYSLIAEAIKKIDVMPRQVMIEALVASVTLTDNLRFGLQWTIQNEFTIKGLKPFNKDINISGPLKLDTPLSASTFSFTALDSAGDIKLLIESLAEDNKAKVLSAPHILVSDNREAKIQVGDQIPIATQLTTNTETTPAQTTTTIQYKDTGTILKVKPQVNDSGLVSLEISQEVSLAETTQVLGTEQFVIRKREVTTNLVAQDGQTIVIGGLIDEQTTKGRAGIPFLSQIPLLGYLFGRTVDDLTRTELIVLLTPRVIRSQTDAGDVTSGYIRRLEDRNKDLDLKKEQFKIDKSQNAPAMPEGTDSQKVTP